MTRAVDDAARGSDTLSPQQRAQIVAMGASMERAIGELQALTEKQRSRALATVAGKTPSEIAKAEGVSPQAVTETLRLPAVTNAVREIISRARIRVPEADRRARAAQPLVHAALEMLSALMYAKKPFGTDGGFVMVADNATRLAACSKVLELYGSGDDPAAPALPSLLEEVAVETSSVKRVSHRRSRVGAQGACTS